MCVCVRERERERDRERANDDCACVLPSVAKWSTPVAAERGVAAECGECVYNVFPTPVAISFSLERVSQF